MKKMMFLIIFFTFNGQAKVITPSDYNCSVQNRSVSCDLFSSTSLPTYMIESEEIDLSSDEAAERLYLEAQGLAEPIVAKEVSLITRRPLDVVLTTALELSQMTGQAAPISEVIKYLYLGIIF